MGDCKYKEGYHERWEAYIHHVISVAKKQNRQITMKEVDQLLASFLEHHRRQAYDYVACSVCQEEIAEARLAGRDPFLVPDHLKVLSRKYGFRLVYPDRQQTGGSISV